jgi:tRNA threonylcarbamoyladenosine biosynthesis protein TsaE
MTRSATAETRSPEETAALGRALGSVLAPGDAVGLVGDLGAGKTVFVRGVAAGVGIAPEVVRSPTFVILVRLEGGRVPLHHVDAYRLAGAEALVDLGIDVVLDPAAATLVEWAPRVAAALPADRLDIEIAHAGQDRRSLRFRASGALSEARLAAFIEAARRAGLGLVAAGEGDASEEEEMGARAR